VVDNSDRQGDTGQDNRADIDSSECLPDIGGDSMAAPKVIVTSG